MVTTSNRSGVGRSGEDDRPNVFLVSKRLKLGSTPIEEIAFPPATGVGAGGVALVFGNEVDGLSGLDQDARETLPAVYLPMNEDVIRSYNLSNAVRTCQTLYVLDGGEGSKARNLTAGVVSTGKNHSSFDVNRILGASRKPMREFGPCE